jgi:hypothetical protein
MQADAFRGGSRFNGARSSSTDSGGKSCRQDILSSDHIGMAGVSAPDTAENSPGGAVFRANMPAARAGLGSIGRVHRPHFPTEPTGFISELAERFGMALFKERAVEATLCGDVLAGGIDRALG